MYLDSALHLRVCMHDLDGSGDDQLWNDSSDDEGDQVEESLPSSWDADEDVPKEDWDKLFEDSEYSDLDDFLSFCYLILMNKCCLKNFVPFDQVKYGGATYTRINTVMRFSIYH